MSAQPERRERRTPFVLRPSKPDLWLMLDDQGKAVAAIEGTEGLARFVLRACNRYDWLVGMADLCRGEFENKTMPYRFPTEKEFQRLLALYLEDLERNGR